MPYIHCQGKLHFSLYQPDLTYIADGDVPVLLAGGEILPGRAGLGEALQRAGPRLGILPLFLLPGSLVQLLLPVKRLEPNLGMDAVEVFDHAGGVVPDRADLLGTRYTHRWPGSAVSYYDYYDYNAAVTMNAFMYILPCYTDHTQPCWGSPLS